MKELDHELLKGSIVLHAHYEKERVKRALAHSKKRGNMRAKVRPQTPRRGGE